MSEIKVDTVAEKTSANGVTVDGLNIKDSKLVTANSVVNSNITADAVTIDKLNLISTGSAPSLEAKGDGSSQDGYIQLNCSQNSHGIKLKSPAHSANASYTLTFPVNDGDANQFLQSNGSGVLSFADAGGGYTQSSVLTPSGASVEFTGIPSGTNSIVIKSYGLQWAGSPGNIFMQIGDSGGYETSGYQSVDFYRGVSAGDMGANTSTSSYLLAYGYSGTDYWNGNLFLNHVGGNRWVMGYWANDVSEYLRIGSGQKILSGELTKLKIFNAGGTNADGGNVQIMYQ